MEVSDEAFVDTLNAISRRHGLTLPTARPAESPSSDFIEGWARFLETCVKKGLALSDPRWRRLNLQSNHPHARFRLEPEEDEGPDPDFRVGLKLLMGILERSDDDTD